MVFFVELLFLSFYLFFVFLSHFFFWCNIVYFIAFILLKLNEVP